MRSSSSSTTTTTANPGTINIAASSQKLDVDNRIALRFYYRIADNILRQADIFRAEKNIIDLYVMLLRFSSLASETIPRHREYKSSPQTKKQSLKKRLLISLNELEKLKPLAQQKINELNSRNAFRQNGRGNFHSNNNVDFSSVEKQTLAGNGQIKLVRATAREFAYQGSSGQHFSYVRPVEEQVRRLSLTLPPPKEETLSRHSILGPHGLNGQWWSPTIDTGVRYPSDIDLSPVELPSLQRQLEDVSLSNKDNNSIAELQKLDLNSIPTESEDSQPQRAQESPSLISFEATEESSAQIEIIRQPSPPPVLAEVHDLVPAMSPHINEAGCKAEIPSSDSSVNSESPLQLHISTALMENFMNLAQSNTKKNLETCGVLAGLLKNRKFYITALIIPKQESTSDSCQTTNEEEIFEVQDKRSLFPLGWIHTHPTQSCFMSSIDVHTHYSYQIMLPESVAIVMAPTDSSRKHGIFRLTTPGGMSVIKQCDQRGFHPHNQPPDGGPIYDTCTDVYMNPDLKFEVIDLR